MWQLCIIIFFFLHFLSSFLSGLHCLEPLTEMFFLRILGHLLTSCCFLKMCSLFLSLFLFSFLSLLSPSLSLNPTASLKEDVISMVKDAFCAHSEIAPSTLSRSDRNRGSVSTNFQGTLSNCKLPMRKSSIEQGLRGENIYRSLNRREHLNNHCRKGLFQWGRRCRGGRLYSHSDSIL